VDEEAFPKEYDKLEGFRKNTNHMLATQHLTQLNVPN
jgi:hypothetical protein